MMNRLNNEISPLESPKSIDRRSELSPQKIIELEKITLTIADGLRGAILAELAKGNTSSLKPDKTVVSNADLAGELKVRELAAKLFPEAGILGEEQGHTNPTAPFQFVTDPVDGTLDLTRGIPTWGAVLALYYHGHPIVGVIDHPHLTTDSRVYASYKRGAFCDGKQFTLEDTKADPSTHLFAVSAPYGFNKISDEKPLLISMLGKYPQTRMFFTCFSQSSAALGKVDLSIEWNLRLWDLASMRIIVEEAGGTYKELRRIRTKDGASLYTVVAGKPSAVAAFQSPLE